MFIIRSTNRKGKPIVLNMPATWATTGTHNMKIEKRANYLQICIPYLNTNTLPILRPWSHGSKCGFFLLSVCPTRGRQIYRIQPSDQLAGSVMSYRSYRSQYMYLVDHSIVYPSFSSICTKDQLKNSNLHNFYSKLSFLSADLRRHP